jgi:hypothetical protein
MGFEEVVLEMMGLGGGGSGCLSSGLVDGLGRFAEWMRMEMEGGKLCL